MTTREIFDPLILAVQGENEETINKLAARLERLTLESAKRLPPRPAPGSPGDPAFCPERDTV